MGPSSVVTDNDTSVGMDPKDEGAYVVSRMRGVIGTVTGPQFGNH